MTFTKNGKKSIGPQIRSDRVFITREEAMRVDRFVMRAGNRRRAGDLLGVGEGTVDLARAEASSMLRATHDKVFAALDVVEKEMQ